MNQVYCQINRKSEGQFIQWGNSFGGALVTRIKVKFRNKNRFEGQENVVSFE